MILPTIEMKQAAMEYRQEFLDSGEASIYGGGGLVKYDNYDEWLKKIILAQTAAEVGKVEATTYFAGGEIVGTTNIRHTLNNELRFEGGHIGYSVRPSKRRRGYATQMLALALEKCREMGIDKVLLTCVKSNVGSAKTIIKAGGVLDSEFVDAGGEMAQRYWITL